MYFDVFNGDADGICALIQLRLHRPLDSILVTGVKRDIQLLDKVAVSYGDQVTVLDISLLKNQAKVFDFLEQGAHIFYVDHHQSGLLPAHPNLTALIDTDANICTGLLVNRYLQGRYALWAVVAACGDNLRTAAQQLATSLAIKPSEYHQLDELGLYVNYNSYGRDLVDLHFSPAQLYQVMVQYTSPFTFIQENPLIFEQLATGYYDDLNRACAVPAFFESVSVNVFFLPDTLWARRVCGVFGNFLANTHPNKANALLLLREDNSYQVSVRAPLTNKTGADTLCARFATGGGRSAAAGINRLPNTDIDEFIRQFDVFYRGLI